MLYVLFAFFSGILIIIAITVNSKFAADRGMLESLIANYLTGSIATLFLLLFMGYNLKNLFQIPNIPPFYLIGGILGIITTFFFNLIMPKLSGVYVVVMRFIFQMLTSVAIDYAAYGIFSFGKLLGASLFVAGLLYNTQVDKKSIV